MFIEFRVCMVDQARGAGHPILFRYLLPLTLSLLRVLSLGFKPLDLGKGDQGIKSRLLRSKTYRLLERGADVLEVFSLFRAPFLRIAQRTCMRTGDAFAMPAFFPDADLQARSHGTTHASGGTRVRFRGCVARARRYNGPRMLYLRAYNPLASSNNDIELRLFCVSFLFLAYPRKPGPSQFEQSAFQHISSQCGPFQCRTSHRTDCIP